MPKSAATSGAPLTLRTGAAMLPHPDKVAKGGEDAYFVSSSGLVLGVADGVGGWGELGIDAGAYARTLMSRAAAAADAATAATPDADPDPGAILTAAHAGTKVPGSSTACVVALSGDRRATLVAANLGDSGFVVARGGSLAFRSPQQQHGFNFPYQLGAPGTASDAPSDADAFSVSVRPGDVVVLGTDGLFDNVFADEAARMACAAAAAGEEPRAAADALAAFARARAGDTRAASPFAVAAQAMGYPYTGGKMDDITVVVAYVEEGEGASQASAKL